MEVYLLKEGQRFGPYSPEQVKEYMESGDFSEADLAFFDGCDGWVSIMQVPGVDPEVDVQGPNASHSEAGRLR